MRRRMHSLYISSFFRLGNEHEHASHENYGNELRINPVTKWIKDHHYELRDSGPSKTEESDI